MSPADAARTYLVGLMGSGKSTVGRRLADQLSCRYVDNDETIAELSGHSTVALAGAGGTHLHDWESRYAHYLRTLPAPLVAGVPASAAERSEELRMLRHSGELLYLRCDSETLVRRVTSDAPRPWLHGDVRSTIAGMFARRDDALRAVADRVIDATQPVEHILAEIMGSAGQYSAGDDARQTASPPSLA